jgi:hypothetical protein
MVLGEVGIRECTEAVATVMRVSTVRHSSRDMVEAAPVTETAAVVGVSAVMAAAQAVEAVTAATISAVSYV